MNVNEAEHAIAEILRKLETDTDLLVDRIIIDDIEITTVDDERPQYVRRVLIDTHRLPGQKWTP